jgi:hypothetical protein
MALYHSLLLFSLIYALVAGVGLIVASIAALAEREVKNRVLLFLFRLSNGVVLLAVLLPYVFYLLGYDANLGLRLAFTIWFVNFVLDVLFFGSFGIARAILQTFGVAGAILQTKEESCGVWAVVASGIVSAGLYLLLLEANP